MYSCIQSKLSIIFYSFGQNHNYICYTLRKAAAKIAQIYPNYQKNALPENRKET